jgi:SAM-dependent methyltransferase
MSLPASYFAELYRQSPDPWSLAERWYESRKYAVTLAALPKSRYRRAFEPGCSVGVLTAMLAERCDELVAVDVAPAAVRIATERTRGHSGVDVSVMPVPAEWPSGSFDLVVLSEVGYYLDAAALRVLVNRSIESLDPGGALVAVHWRHPVADYPLHGDDVHAALLADDRITPLVRHEEADFLLDVLVRPPAVSVAAAEGLVP